MTSEKVSITALEIENVKRVSALSLEPNATGLTIIGGNNRQGKTSALNAIMAALGGKKFDPTNAVKDGEEKGVVNIALSNGLTVHKTFTDKGSYLKVVDPDGTKAGQTLLDSFISAFALDLGMFLHSSDKKRASILLDTIGLDLTPYEEKHAKLYADREAVGRDRRRAKDHAESMPYDDEAGVELFNASEIMDNLQEILNINAERERLRNKRSKIRADIEKQDALIERLVSQLADARAILATLQAQLQVADEPPAPEDTSQLSAKLSEMELLNARVRKNLDRQKALAEEEIFAEEYRSLTDQIEQNKEEMQDLLAQADMPFPSLSVESGVVFYKDQPWDCMSGAEQLIVSAAVCQRVNPKMGFVLIDRIESIDLPTLKEFGRWLADNSLQAITTRVSTGDECSIIIQDGQALSSSQLDASAVPLRHKDAANVSTSESIDFS